MNIFNKLITENLENSEKIFLNDGNSKLSFSEFIRLVKNRSQDLQNKGVTKNSKIINFSRRGFDFWIDVLAIWKLQAIIIPLDPNLGKKTFSLIYNLLSSQTTELPSDNLNIDILDTYLLPNCESDIEELENVATILFTSGSTGISKGVLLSHEAILGNSEGILNVLPLSCEDKFFINIPFNFTSAICHFIAALKRTCEFVCTEIPMLPGDFLSFISVNKITGFGGAPIQFNWLADAPKIPNSLKWAMSSGDKLSKITIRKCSNFFDIFVVYGLTEVGGRLCCLPPENINKKIGSVGKPIKGLDVFIRSEDGQKLLNKKKVGEIYVKGKWLMKKYYRNDLSTMNSMTKYGFKSGDIGYLDDEGFLFIEGRSDDIFKVSGQKVSSIVIEETLNEIEQIVDAAVIPMEIENLGQIPYAIIVIDKNKTVSNKEILHYLRNKLPNTHIPRKIVQIDKIERTGSGKIKRQVLKEKLLLQKKP